MINSTTLEQKTALPFLMKGNNVGAFRLLKVFTVFISTFCLTVLMTVQSFATTIDISGSCITGTVTLTENGTFDGTTLGVGKALHSGIGTVAGSAGVQIDLYYDNGLSLWVLTFSGAPYFQNSSNTTLAPPTSAGGWIATVDNKDCLLGTPLSITGTGTGSSPVVLTCPINTTTTACQTQTTVNTAFAAWLAIASGSGGCNGMLTNNNTGAPSNCGGPTTVTFTYSSTCLAPITTCQATFTVPTPPTTVLTCPVNTTTTACQTQAAVNTAFAAWLATVSSSGGCNGILTNNNTGAPSACGGSTTVTFTYTSTCAPLTTTCQATFAVPAPTTVILTCPVNTTTTACQTQAAVNTAFAAWLATASSSGGCNGVLTNNNTGAPSACGGSTTVIFTNKSTCAPLTTTCQATFTVPAPSTIAMTCPAPITVCADAIPAPNIASVTGVTGCGVVVTFVNDVPSSPLSDKSYKITRTYRATDNCSNSITCTQTITVKALSTAPTSISGTTNICLGSSTTLTLVGGTAGTGAIAEWFTGSCGGTSAGTGNSIIVAPTVLTTYFVRYKGDCNTTACANVTVTITTPSVGGIVSPAKSQGCGPQTINLSVSGINGVVTQWEQQTNCIGAWASIGSAGLTAITVTTPNSSTCYRAVVTNGVCPSANSSIATITVDKPAVGGKVTLQSNMTATSISLCPSENTVLLAKGFVGKVATWQYSFSTSPIWYDLPGTVGQTTLTVNGSSIVGTVFYRVVICSELGLCTGWSAVAYSSAFRITQKTGCLSPDGSLVNNYIATDQRLTIQKVYPNPANALITLEIEANTEGVAQVEIMDVIGRQVLNQTATLTEGMNSINLDISQLSKGVFIIKMTDSKNQKAWVKMVKE